MEHRLGFSPQSFLTKEGPKAVQDDRLVVAVIELAPDGQALLEQELGLIALALLMIDLSQMMEDLSLIVVIADPATELEPLLAHLNCLLPAALEPVDISEAGQCLRFAYGIAGSAEQAECLQGNRLRLVVSLPKPQQPTHVLQRVTLTARVVQFSPDRQAGLVRGFRFRPPSLFEVGETQVIESQRLSTAVAGAPGCLQRTSKEVLGIAPVAPDL